MDVTVLKPIREAGLDYKPGDVFSTKPSRAWRLAELGMVKAPSPWEYDYKAEWAELRKFIGARPEGIIAFPTRRQSLKELRPGEKFLILRKYGGLGDILIASMMFSDLKEQYPDIHVTFAPPKQYHDLFLHSGLSLLPYEKVFSGHGWSNRAEMPETLRTSYDLSSGVNPDVLKEFDLIEDISIPCHVWENFFVRYGGVNNGGNGLLWRNRLDMWSQWFGLKVKRAETCINIMPDELEKGRQIIRRYAKSSKPALIFSPIAANVTKSYGWYKELTELLKKDWNVILLHAKQLGYEKTLAGLSYREMGMVCAAADLILSVDTATFHWGGILKRPTVGIFNVNDGETYARYYPSAVIVQTCNTPCINTRYNSCDKLYHGPFPTPTGVGIDFSKCYHKSTVQKVYDTVQSHWMLKAGL